jgi:hypothetical protein
VLDTSVLVHGGFEHLDGELAISAVSLAELHFGVLVASDDDRRAQRLQRVALVERLFEPLAVDSAVARSYGRLAAQVVRGRRQPSRRAFDLLIAATALAHGARLCTHDEDLAGLAGTLEIVVPARP